MCFVCAGSEQPFARVSGSRNWKRCWRSTGFVGDKNWFCWSLVLLEPGFVGCRESSAALCECSSWFPAGFPAWECWEHTAGWQNLTATYEFSSGLRSQGRNDDRDWANITRDGFPPEPQIFAQHWANHSTSFPHFSHLCAKVPGREDLPTAHLQSIQHSTGVLEIFQLLWLMQ